VPEVGKLDGNWCPKSTPCNGCSIYATRPEACKKYACVWLNGKGEDADRPDILGVIMDIEDFKIENRDVCIVHLWEIEKGAMEKPRVQAIAETNKRGGNIVISHLPQGTEAFVSTISIAREHFSSLDLALFKLTYR
jgi:Fe-S-cluster containining protein